MATRFENISFMTGLVSELNKRRDRLTAIEDKKAKKAQADKLFDLSVKERSLKIDQLETAGEVDDLFIQGLREQLKNQKSAGQSQSKVDNDLLSNAERKEKSEARDLGQMLKQTVKQAKRGQFSQSRRIGKNRITLKDEKPVVEEPNEQSESEKVKVQDQEGNIGFIPKENLQKALDLGAILAE